jgi:PAS domain-containing protein
MDAKELAQITEKLSQLEERRELALSLGGVGIWDWHIPTGKLYWDDEMLKIYSIKRSEFCECYDDFRKRLHPDDIKTVEEQIFLCFEKKERYIFRFRVKRGGGYCVVSGFGNCIRDKNGVPVRMVGVNIDEGDLCPEHEQRFCHKDPCETCPTKKFKNF